MIYTKDGIVAHDQDYRMAIAIRSTG
ncbi:hypothetical protein [Cylindrospermopsis curvispora]|nr:hypothetical protein [Cylindrospermopsis curvispora]